MFHVMADFDGDGYWEGVLVYRQHDGAAVEVYKHNGRHWGLADRWAGWGYDIHTLYQAEGDARSGGASRLVIGWRAVDGSAYWSVYEWARGTFRETERYEESRGVWGEEAVAPYRGTALYSASVKTVDGIQWGYIDPSGRMAIPPRYDYAREFQDNGLAIVSVKDRDGAIDATGAYRIEPRWSSINDFSEGLAIAMDEKGFHVINSAGAEVTAKPYDYISSYRDGRAMFSVTQGDGPAKYGYLDPAGKEVIAPQYLEAGDFHNGKAVVKAGDKEYRLIGRNGEKLATYPYPFVGALGEGLLAFQKEVPGKYGYLNEKGDVVIPPKFTGAMAFQEGRAVVNTAEDYGNKYGLIDTKGEYAVQPGYNDILQLGEGRVALGQAIHPDQPYIGSRYAIADLNGHVLTAFAYYDVQDYANGYASVNDGKNTFFIDRTGARAAGLPAVPGTGTLVMMGSLIQANVDIRVSYLDRSGRIVWEQNKVIPLTPPYRVVEVKYKPNKDYLVYYPQVEGMRDRAAEKQVNAKLKELAQVKPVDPAAQLDSTYTGDFSVAFFRQQLLVLELNGYDYPFGAAHGMPYRVYAHVDLVTGRFYTLADLFKPGSDYAKVLSGIVAEQIKNDPQYSYVWPDSYKGVAPDQPFYVTGEALHVYYAPYEIAPYAAGFPTFTIPFAQLESILAKDGAFWRSFHPQAGGSHSSRDLDEVRRPQPASYKTLQEALVLVRKAIAGEREDELFYDYLISEAPTAEAKEIIGRIRDDERKHRRMYREIYRVLTGQPAPAGEGEEFEKPASYPEGLRKAFFGELAAMERYRDIRAGMPNRVFRDMVFEILTDELKHAQLYQYLMTLPGGR
ncbi:WG repeat-containing protein [Gorillibacterium sp. sgz5001074]|uniref:WG repeat-containing protein n=1 Tax=Gorillibacterium sp. sgz5001074 TaxID=3446695 RepID=UPI003F67A4EC